MDDALNKERLKLVNFIGGPIRILGEFIEKTPSFCYRVGGSLGYFKASAQRRLDLRGVHFLTPFHSLPDHRASRAPVVL